MRTSVFIVAVVCVTGIQIAIIKSRYRTDTTDVIGFLLLFSVVLVFAMYNYYRKKRE